MGISQACFQKQKECADFSFRLEITDNLFRLMEYGGGFVSSLSLLAVAVEDFIRSRRLVRQIREIMGSCRTDCEKAECLGAFYQAAEKVRDSYLRFCERIEQSKVRGFFLKRMIEKNLDEWDELAVDCRVGGDEDFRGLVFQIAEKI